jgi:predicted nucleotidyltransferase
MMLSSHLADSAGVERPSGRLHTYVDRVSLPTCFTAIADELGTELDEIAARFAARAVLLCGSIVRGEYSDNSDIEICVLTAEGRGRRVRRKAAARELDIFVEGVDALRRDLVAGRKLPVLWLLSEGVVIRGDRELGARLRSLTQALLKGPPRVPRERAFRLRHEPEALLRKLEANRDDEVVERMLACRLASVAMEVVITKNGKWTHSDIRDHTTLSLVSPHAAIIVTRLLRATFREARLDEARRLVTFIRGGILPPAPRGRVGFSSLSLEDQGQSISILA